VPDLTLDLTDPQTGGARELFVVTGPAGSGKTRLLEAIVAAKEVIAPYGLFAPVEGWLAEDAAEAVVELDFALDADEQSFCESEGADVKARVVFAPEGADAEVSEGVRELLGRYEHDARVGKMDYLPANRALPPPGDAHGLSAMEQRLSRLGRDPDKYSFVPRLLVQAATDPSDTELRPRLESALASVSRELRFVVHPSDPLRCLSYAGSEPVAPSELGTTAAHALLVAATAALVRYDRSIVLLDRPECAVEERSLGAFVRGLLALAPGVQLIVASSSPSLKAGLDGRAIHTLGAAA
jgi:hypothetical protein